MAWPTQKNYKGKEIPTSVGVLFIVGVILYIPFLAAISGLGFASLFDFSVYGNRVWTGLYGLVAVTGLLGLLDDVFGSSQARGFKGHFGALLHGEVTTGLLKAAGGGLAALVVAWWVPGLPTILEVFINGLIIALTINVFNLLDLRPGRVLKVYFFSLVILVSWSFSLSNMTVWHYLVPLVAIAAGLFSGDIGEKFMLGDAGSNVLGASVGFTAMILSDPLTKVGLLVVLVALNVISEIWSFSKIIESRPFLKWLDDLGRLS